MLYGLITNIIVMGLYYWGLYAESLDDAGDHDHDKIFPRLHGIFWISSLIILTLTLPSYILSITLDPGYIKPKYDFTDMVEKALDYGQHLDNFCSYCEVIKTQTSFHCTICNKCVELYDHHCPFINNCLGYRNHKFFLIWITLYLFFLLDLLLEITRHIFEFIYNDWYTNIDWTITAILIVMIFLHLPIIGYQVYSQCGNLCKRPVNTFTSTSHGYSSNGSDKPEVRTDAAQSVT